MLAMVASFLFSSYRIEKAAFTDEHYWFFDRTPGFWKDILERDWNGTRESDKPGVTLMAISGPSLLGVPNFLEIEEPEEFFEGRPEEISKINLAFRLPVLLFFVLSLVVFYFIIRELLGRKLSLLSIVFLSTSPILIGMSRIANPDSLLWIFSAWTALGFFVYLKNNQKKWLFLAGVFMGLALLTKYVSSFAYVFLLAVILLEPVFKKGVRDRKTISAELKNRSRAFLGFIVVSVATFTLLYPATWVKFSRIPKGTFFSEAFEPIFPFFAGIIVFIFVDIFLLKGRLLGSLLGFLSSQKRLLGRIIFSLFTLIVLVVFVNVYAGNQWFDFEKVLVSPKSSYRTEGILSIFISNFYPLLFAISPVALFSAALFSAKAAFGKVDFSKNNTKVALYLVIFILLYHTGSVFSQVASIIRYQIMLYPIVFVLGAIGAMDLWKSLKNFLKIKSAKAGFVAATLLLFFLLAPLAFSKPFYMAYASFLLPQKYHLDLKDMGYGSYEAARRLNSLPNAQKLTIWTDKRGVCNFFVGECFYTLKLKDIKNVDFDYYVVSAGRFSKVNAQVQMRVGSASPNTIRLDKLYEVKDPFWELKIAGRGSNFVKIVKADTIKIK